MVIVEVPHFSLSYDVAEHVAFHGRGACLHSG